MLSEFLLTLGNGIITRIVNTFEGWDNAKFYFIALLVFLFAVGYLYRDVATMTVQNALFNEIRFRDCRDVIGLQKAFEQIIAQDTAVNKYVVYLYQPINNSLYKKAVLTNSEIIMRSPSLQGIYLKTQPTINEQLLKNNYYIVDKREADNHPDLQYMIDVSNHSRLFYALKIDGKVIGEIAVRYKHPPSPLEIEHLLKELSPLLYGYII